MELFVKSFHSRLDFEENEKTSKTFAKYRMGIFITAFIWAAAAIFCRQHVHSILKAIQNRFTVKRQNPAQYVL